MSGETASVGALHLLQHESRDALADLRAFCAAGDAVVLLCAGVLAMAREGFFDQLPPGVRVLAHAGDVAAQGLASLAGEQKVELIDDGALVRLVAAYPHCLTWR